MTVADIISRFDEKTAAVAWELRNFLQEQLMNVTELPDQSISLIGYGYGTGYKDLICTMLLSKKGVKLGFYKGTELPDPQHLLTGSGKVHRYAEIQSLAGIRNPALKELLAAALNAYQTRKQSSS